MDYSKKRLKVGIILNASPNWIGGVIYIINVVKVFNWLDDDKKPVVSVFYRPELKRFVDEIEYPYLEIIEWKFPSLVKGYIMSWLSRKNQFVDPIIKHRNVDVLFPVLDFPIPARKDVKMIAWYADLQHKYYPNFFSKKKIIERDMRIRFILSHSQHLVLSSLSVDRDFETFFQPSAHITRHIYQFASVIDNFDFQEKDKIRSEFGIPEHYFMVSNQFHSHKNHQIILRALELLKPQGVKPFFVMTGKLPENAGSIYIEEIRDLLRRFELDDQIVFLGVLSREKQLTLMRFAQAIVQPSLFEGWSTVIEDAISLQTPVLASNIDVNIEQLGDRGVYFDPMKPEELANLLISFPIRSNYDIQIYEPYEVRIRRAALCLLGILE